MLTKAELLGQLTNAKNNYVLGVAATSLFGMPESYRLLPTAQVSFGAYSLNLDQVSRLLENKRDRDIAVKEFVKMLLRALVKEPFELIKDYCGDTSQSTSLKSEGWYQFARIIRNCLSHNFRFEFNKYDKRLLPVTWRARTITVAMNRQPLELSFFGYVEAWELFCEFHKFAEVRLK